MMEDNTKPSTTQESDFDPWETDTHGVVPSTGTSGMLESFLVANPDVDPFDAIVQGCYEPPREKKNEEKTSVGKKKGKIKLKICKECDSAFSRCRCGVRDGICDGCGNKPTACSCQPLKDKPDKQLRKQLKNEPDKQGVRCEECMMPMQICECAPVQDYGCQYCGADGVTSRCVCEYDGMYDDYL